MMSAVASPRMEPAGGEEAPASLQRMWSLARARHSLSGGSALDPNTLEPFPRAQEPTESPNKKLRKPALDDVDSDVEEQLYEHDVQEQVELSRQTACRAPVFLDAGALGDLPAVYRVAPLKPHQQPVVGVYIDRRVHAGFRYRIQPLESLDEPESARKPRPLFKGQALTLLGVGRGYARRFTFESGDSPLNANDHYFWSDSRPEGFAFEIEAVSIGDKFTVCDANGEPQGALEVVQLQKEQIELEQTINPDGSIEKKVQFDALCKIEWYERKCEAGLIPVSGVAVVRRARAGRAGVLRVLAARIGVKSKANRGFELSPGVQSGQRRITVAGADIGDVPTKYTVVGLESYELPVIGTYVDPRIIAGFSYRARAAGSRRHMFGGRSLRLLNIGAGYAKRLTFAPDTLNDPENHFWSDSHADGAALEPRAVDTGMRFQVTANGEHLGEATVFRADLPQVEERTEFLGGPPRSRMAVQKHVHVDVTCHVTLATTRGGSVDEEVHLMRVSGVALVRKEPGASKAELLKVYNVGLDSQLNQLFVQSQTELTFHPLP